MALATLLHKIDIPCTDERRIAGISDDSRQVGENWIFLARRGTMNNGEDYVQAALSKGAVVVWEKENGEHCYHCDDILRAQTILLDAFYQEPWRHLCVIGVTGTNGKTSVSALLAQMFALLGKKTMVIGTGHIRYENQDIPMDNTTPSACTLAAYFHMAETHAIPIVIMEVSSHAIDQKRIGFIRFDYIIYTNITSDHLDYHITRTHYQYTKLKLRHYLKRNGIIIVNHDDPSLHPLYDFHDHKIVTIGVKQAHLQLSDLKLKPYGSAFCFQQEAYSMRLLGVHNVYNVAQCLVVLHAYGTTRQKRQAVVASLHGVKGRMEVHEMHHRYVIVDYAHTASSLQMLLQIGNEIKERKLIVVCGCGGNRDRSKRSQMANIALTYADTAIFTSDNPRYEPPHQILSDMIQAASGPYEIFENRRCAIKYAVKIAQERDIIMIAGKGDEQYQSINGKQYPFGDWECAKQMLEDERYED